MQKFPELFGVLTGIRKPSAMGVKPGDYDGALVITDYAYILKELGEINKQLPRQLKRDYREAAIPVQKDAQAAIRAARLGRRGRMRGFAPRAIPGRLAWGVGKPATSSTIRTPRPNSRKKSLAIAQVVFWSPAAILADMGGRTMKGSIAGSKTRLYPYSRAKSGQRSHLVTAEGSQKFVNNLNTKIGTDKSRMIYPSTDKSRKDAKAAIARSTDIAVAIINRKLGSR
jgi:hypothetical protein